ncbi:ABC transporter substrate-binding protein [Phyllobacterium endophyticum]|uniref:ABC transporter substrate-binding protein n=1 Tax=Phyllobacterium endophyticum TaxID=1149773 RepID=UPI0014749814|nr:extracellular solute-binding protein [Phyllobacterium endophyticum]MBB3236738.1 spermidine/putrescine transport system substrate-binding protein [Phyllobacterium endophyticum]
MAKKAHNSFHTNQQRGTDMRKIWSTEDILQLHLSRRVFLGGATALAGGVALGPFLPGSAHAAGGDLQIMAWEGWELSDELADWRTKNGVNVEVSAIGNQDDVTSKFSSGNPPPFDAAEYNQGYSDLYIDVLKITKPLDKAKIPNYSKENLFDVFYDKPTWYRDGKLHGVPYAWGLNALVYAPDKVEKPASYTDLLKPEFKGKIAIVDDTLATWPLAATLAGFGSKFPHLTKDEMASTFENLVKYRDQARVISLTYGDAVSLMVSGEVVAVLIGWTGIPVETAKQGLKTEYTIPKEGATTWCDAWFMPPSVDNEETSYKFINEAISPEIQAKVVTRNAAGVVSSKAVELLPPETKALFDYSDVNGIFKAAPLLGIPPLKSAEHATYADWVAAWNEFKAG